MFLSNNVICTGGKKNENGKKFESKLNNELFLINNKEYKEIKFTNKSKKEYYYLFKEYNDKKIYYMKQKAFTQFLDKNYKIKSLRDPDEIYIIIYNDNKIIFYIIEIKNQNVEGSVDQKLWSSPTLKKEYEIYLSKYIGNIEIIYSLTVSKFLQEKFENKKNIKYQILQDILTENNISIFYGDEIDYFIKINKFIENL